MTPDSGASILEKLSNKNKENIYTQKADDSIQKYGFSKYSNAEDLDEKYLKLKPTSQRTF